MTNILAQIAQSRLEQQSPGSFRPAFPSEYFALRLAHKLGEGSAVRHYVQLVNNHSERRLLAAYRRACGISSEASLSRRFHVELTNSADSDNDVGNLGKLAALRIERRAVAVAFLSGERIDYPPAVRQLPSDPSKALGSVAVFMERLLDKHPVRTVALEALPEKCPAQRHQLVDVLTSMFEERGAAIRYLDKLEVIRSFGHPPLRFREQVREVISEMWPVLDGRFHSPLLKDALALGLYCHVEALFNH